MLRRGSALASRTPVCERGSRDTASTSRANEDPSPATCRSGSLRGAASSSSEMAMKRPSLYGLQGRSAPWPTMGFRTRRSGRAGRSGQISRLLGGGSFSRRGDVIVLGMTSLPGAASLGETCGSHPPVRKPSLNVAVSDLSSTPSPCLLCFCWCLGGTISRPMLRFAQSQVGLARRQLHPLKFDRSRGPVARVVAPRRGTRVRGMLLPVS